MAIVLDEPSTFEVLLNYALFAGAIFQLICIFVVIIVPQSESEKAEETLANAAISGSQTSVPANRSSHEHHGRRGRKEKKKHK